MGRFLRSSASMLAILALTGCASSFVEFERSIGLPVETWDAVREARQPEVSTVRFEHPVRFDPGSSALNAAEAGRVLQFLRRIGPSSADHVFIAGAPATAASAMTTLGPRRERAIAELLQSQLIEATLLPSGIEAPPLAPDTVMILVRRAIVSLPPCPDWTQMPGDNFDNQPMSNWSCATAVNFGMMVADPADLLRGRDPGFADGEYLARSIERYRAGKTKPIIRDSASSEIFQDSGGSGNGK